MNYLRVAFTRMLHGLESVESVVCVSGLLLTTLLACADVLNRLWLHIGGVWLGNLALYCFIFFMTLAVTVTTWREGHVAVDLFRSKFLAGKPRSVAVHRLCLDAVSIGCACAFLPPSFGFTLRALKYPEYGTAVNWFNTSWLMVVPFVALVLLLVHLLVIGYRDARDVIRMSRVESEGSN